MAESGVSIVIQHGHVVTETGLDPIAAIDLAFGKSERRADLIDVVISGFWLMGFTHNLNVQMRTGGMTGLTNLPKVVAHPHLITFDQMFGGEILHVGKPNVVIASLIQNDDRVAPTPIVSFVAAIVVGEVCEAIANLNDGSVNRGEYTLPKGIVVSTLATIKVDGITQVPRVSVGTVLPLGAIPVGAVMKRHEDERAGICLTSEEANPKEKGGHNRDFSVSHPDLLARLNVPVLGHSPQKHHAWKDHPGCP